MNKLLIAVAALCVAVLAGTALLRNNTANRAEALPSQGQQGFSAAAPGGPDRNAAVAAPGGPAGNAPSAAPKAASGKQAKGAPAARRPRGPVDPDRPEFTVFRLPGENQPKTAAAMTWAEADRPGPIEIKWDLKDRQGICSTDHIEFVKPTEAEKSATALSGKKGAGSQNDDEYEVVTVRIRSGTGKKPDRETKVLVKKRDGKNPLFESRVAPPEGSSATAAKKDAAPAKPLPKPGSLLTIGSYPQKGLLGRQPLRWRVLETFGDDKLLVVTETVIDTMPFHKERPPKERAAQKVTWENSDIRKWLNEEFFDKTFSTGEKKRIYTTSIECGPYTNGCVGCYRTEDRVFLLSSGDAERYFIDNADRVCIPTGYARKRRIFTDKVGGRCWWWLRSSTKADHTVVDYIGGISESAEPSAMNIFGVRPAMVIRYPK